MSWSKVALLLGVLAIAVGAWLLRWSDPVQYAENGAMVVDRWTGDVWVLYSSGSGTMKAKIVADYTKEMSPK